MKLLFKLKTQLGDLLGSFGISWDLLGSLRNYKQSLRQTWGSFGISWDLLGSFGIVEKLQV